MNFILLNIGKSLTPGIEKDLFEACNILGEEGEHCLSKSFYPKKIGKFPCFSDA